MRIHSLRAVKTKLPKGAYVILLSMYDRLGGRPIRWVESGNSGDDGDTAADAVNPERPACTSAVRELYFNDSESMKFSDNFT
jgi:hypothetical protein